jgi:hypothetical protein
MTDVKYIADVAGFIAFLIALCFLIWLVTGVTRPTCCKHCHTHEEDSDDQRQDNVPNHRDRTRDTGGGFRLPRL